MPCPKRFAAALKETTTDEDGNKMYTWRAVRRQHLRMLRKQTRTIVLFMAIIEILRVGAPDIVYGGKHGTKAPGTEDYGIAYQIGSFLAWIYMCLFAMVWAPLFSWWVPNLSNDAENPDSRTGNKKMDSTLSVLDKINNVLLPAVIGLSLLQHAYHVICTFVYVDARPVDSSVKAKTSLNSKKNWMVRLLLLGGVIMSMTCGKAMFTVLEAYDLAHVKCFEYMVIVLPIQINLGILMGSAVQFKAEQRAARKAARKDIEADASVDEKQRLLTAEE